ncbi:MAG: phenylalanine--tRNA ligase subunit beta [Rhodospirillales bacterium]|nr:phenylalanine--tRNA ligase subunit beta [Rhodospirillales bacterium]
MKVPLSWLKRHLETAASVDTIVERLTMIGLEVDGVADRGRGLEDFVVARVVEAHRHPDADKLSVCVVDAGPGTGIAQVVCGAPNARAGLMGVFAPVGTHVPGTGVFLKRATIRGVESNGMLLSERELGLSDEHTGIIELPAEAPLGARVVDVLGLADPVIDVAVTPNRGDCLGVRGIARDLAAAGAGTLKSLPIEAVPGQFSSPIRVFREFSDGDGDACPYFVGRYIRGVTNRESPEWLKRLLLAAGLRPISALVDITNLMTLNVCRPLHAFDADRVRGDLHVRLARPGERLAALNGREYGLGGSMTVIADDEEPQALGGVMGGERTACTGVTRNVFLEAALFDPVRTATTGRELSLPSDARYRFERGVDPSFVIDGMEMATRLVLDLCGGEASDLVIAGAEPEWRRTVAFRPERVRTLAGVDVPESEAQRILEALGFSVSGTGGEALDVAVPPWRTDVVGEACLVEEVVRIAGYDRVPATPLPRLATLPEPALTPSQRRRALARRTLATRGLVEAVTYSFMSSASLQSFAPVPNALRLVNPISADLDTMRPTILPNLIAAAGRNADRGVADAHLFEVGPQYAGVAPEDQRMVAAGIRCRRTGPKHWDETPRAWDVFDAKADAMAVLTALGAPADKLIALDGAPDWYHPGRSGTVRLGPTAVLAVFGEIHPRVLRQMDVSGPVAAFEVFIDTLPSAKRRAGSLRPPLALSPFQPVERDFAFIVDRSVAAQDLVRAARGADKALISEVRVFDLFVGESLGVDKKSLGITVVLQPTERTLTDADLESVAEKVRSRVEKATGGALRT